MIILKSSVWVKVTVENSKSRFVVGMHQYGRPVRDDRIAMPACMMLYSNRTPADSILFKGVEGESTGINMALAAPS